MTARDRLIESTQELLWERGYTGTSPKAIQEAAGVGQGSMYHHFGGKSELAAAALQHSADELQTRAEGEFRGPGSALNRLRSYLLLDREILRGCRIGRMTQDPGVTDDTALRAPIADTLAWLTRQLDDLLIEAQTAGDLATALNTTDTAATIAATLQGGYVLARAQASPEPFEQAITGVLGLLELAAT